MGRKWGYCRVSTEDQDLTVQLADLKAAGVPEPFIFSEKKTGTTVEGREELRRLLALVAEGDVVHVTRIDRMARSLKDFADIVADLKARGVGLKVIKQNIDTSAGGLAGELTMNILAAVASFETALRRERQMEGIAKARADGVYKGRRPKIKPVEVRALHASGMGPAAIARQLGICRSSVYRALTA
jgi:DNA invertase Pin-like site-specific DNA recombinase